MRDDVPSGLAESEPTARDAAVVGAALARAAPDTGPPPTGGPWTRWVQRTTGGAALYPLAVLFGLNMVDELDRTAFGVLTPEIRDHFSLELSGILTVVSLSYLAALVLALPIGLLADRRARVRLGATGAAMWGVFSVLTGLAPALLLLADIRRLLDLALVATLAIAGCSAAVAVSASLLERRWPFARLRLAGAPLRTLRRVVVLEALAPLAGTASWPSSPPPPSPVWS